ncbi:hypothetical protein BD779DRAFT_1470596 [Infundibulicybe gibba]|nr:hypothetical protein BD779DRAFT_1470596 [Infundibulicybe gibba]
MTRRRPAAWNTDRIQRILIECFTILNVREEQSRVPRQALHKDVLVSVLTAYYGALMDSTRSWYTGLAKRNPERFGSSPSVSRIEEDRQPAYQPKDDSAAGSRKRELLRKDVVQAPQIMPFLAKPHEAHAKPFVTCDFVGEEDIDG